MMGRLSVFLLTFLHDTTATMDANLRKAALEYHEHGRPGKISVTPTKQLTNQ
ncbi:hypothetical protein WC439_12705, partial [Bordetella avium]